MMKKVWLIQMAVVLVFGLAILSCGDESPAPDGEDTVVFKLTEELAKVGKTGTVVDADFKDTALQAAGSPTYTIVTIEGGALAVEIETKANWGEGLDIRHSAVSFQKGDKIKVTGQVLEAFPPAPSSGDTWATPLLYFATGVAKDPKTVQLFSPPAGPFNIEHILTATDINDITTITGDNPANVRIGGRPAGAKFRIDEVTVTRIADKPQEATFTVTFLGTDKATVLGAVSGIESGFIVPPATTTESWYTAFMSGIAEGYKFSRWRVLGTDASWNLRTGTVTENVSLYAELAEVVEINYGSYGITSLNEFSVPQEGNFGQWIVNVADLAEAAYFVIVTDGTLDNANVDGFGGLKAGWQKNSGSYGMSEGIAAKGWTVMPARSGTCYFFIELGAIGDNYADTAGSDENVRFYVGYWHDFNELAATGQAALLKGIAKPADAVDINTDGDAASFGFVLTEAQFKTLIGE